MANLHALSKKIGEDVAGGVKRISEEVAGGAKAADLASFAADRKEFFASCKEIIASSAAESRELNGQLNASIASSAAESRELNRQLNASIASSAAESKELNSQLSASIASSAAESRELNRQLNASIASSAAESKELNSQLSASIAFSAAESKELNSQLYTSIASFAAESKELNSQLSASCAANSKQQAQLGVSVKSLEESVKAMVRKCTSFDNWHRGQTDNLEVHVLACLRKHLMEQQGLEEGDILEHGCRKVEHLDGFLERGFEWDGVLYIPSKEPKLYLFEGKSAVKSDDIRKMGERMQRTVRYIASCSAEGSLQALEASAGYQTLKAGPKAMHSHNRETWANYGGCKVIGAMGGGGLPEGHTGHG